MLLICDANILIDLDIAGLIGPAFSLFRCAVPDLLFYEELEERHGHLLGRGLELKELDSAKILRMVELVARYPRPGRNDLSALVLAEFESCTLLTGDAALRATANMESVDVRGTLWLVGELVTGGGLSIAEAKVAYDRMRQKGRRLPWAEVESQLTKLGR